MCIYIYIHIYVAPQSVWDARQRSIYIVSLASGTHQDKVGFACVGISLLPLVVADGNSYGRPWRDQRLVYRTFGFGLGLTALVFGV